MNGSMFMALAGRDNPTLSVAHINRGRMFASLPAHALATVWQPDIHHASAMIFWSGSRSHFREMWEYKL